MGSSADWFARRLGGGTAAAPPSAPTAPAQAPAQQPQQHQPAQTPAPGQPLDPAEDPNAPSVSNLLRNASFAERASKARKYEVESCPGCGSANYFSRNFSEGGAPRRGPSPQPQCYDCGYPTIQYGSQLGEGGIQQAAGGSA